MINSILSAPVRAALAAALLIATTMLNAQPHAALHYTSKGFAIQLAHLQQNIQITASYKTPFSRNDVPSILSLSVGRQLYLTNNEADNYTITPSIGIARTRVKDFTAYAADPRGIAPIVEVQQVQPIYTLEVGKDMYLGRVFLSANYCGGAYYGAGFKFFLYR